VTVCGYTTLTGKQLQGLEAYAVGTAERATGKPWPGTGELPAAASASTPAPTTKAASRGTVTNAASGGAAGGAGTMAQPTPLLTPAFMPGSPGYKLLTGM
jgi:hypothetical protein